MPSPPPRSSIPQLGELDLVLVTPRLRLRPIAVSDVDALWPYVSDPAFPLQMSWEAHEDKQDTVMFIERMLGELAANATVPWAIELDGRAVGVIGLHGVRWQVLAWRVDRAELGYWIAPELWGRGLMTEAAREVVRFGFETLGLHKITVGCLETNPGSRRVIEKTGFRFVGRQEEDVWRGGQWHAHERFELTRGAWS